MNCAPALYSLVTGDPESHLISQPLSSEYLKLFVWRISPSPTLSLKAGFYDLFIHDIKMPKMDRFELHRQLKKIDNTLRSVFWRPAKCIMKNLEERNFVNWIKIYFYENPSRMHTAYRDNKFKGKKSNFWGSSNLGAQCFEFSVVLAVLYLDISSSLLHLLVAIFGSTLTPYAFFWQEFYCNSRDRIRTT